MVNYTARNQSPFIEVSQSQKETTHNEALRILDIVTNLLIKDRDLSTPPGSPVDGDTYIVGPSPSGAWSGNAGKIAFFYGGWSFINPFEGLQGWVDDEEKPIIYSDGVWIDFRDGSSGTFTPTLRGSTVNGVQTYGTRTGQWIRDGKTLHIWSTIEVTTLDVATSGDLQITGVPLSTLNTTNTRQPLTVGIRGNLTLSAGYSMFSAYIGHNSTIINLSQLGSNVTQSNLQASAASSGLIIDLYGAIRIN